MKSICVLLHFIREILPLFKIFYHIFVIVTRTEFLPPINVFPKFSVVWSDSKYSHTVALAWKLIGEN